MPTVWLGLGTSLIQNLGFSALLDNGFNSFELGNVGAVEILEKWFDSSSQFDLSTDFTMYSFNSGW